MEAENTSMDDIYERFNQGYYHSMQSLEESMTDLFERTRARCKNTLAFKYLELIRAQSLNYLHRKSDFRTKWLNYFGSRFE